MIMIDDKKIEEAAFGYADDSRGFEAFIDGANWAINEFLKDLWHPVSEKPKRDTIYLAQIGNCGFDTFYDSDNWKSFSKGVNITHWCYIDDLFPKK